MELHHDRENNPPKPYFKKGGLPKSIANVIENVDKIVEVMNGTEFRHSNIFNAFVSEEIITVIRQAKHHLTKNTISLVVRLSLSSHNLAGRLIHVSLDKLRMEMGQSVLAIGIYRQTGITTIRLSKVEFWTQHLRSVTRNANRETT